MQNQVPLSVQDLQSQKSNKFKSEYFPEEKDNPQHFGQTKSQSKIKSKNEITELLFLLVSHKLESMGAQKKDYQPFLKKAMSQSQPPQNISQMHVMKINLLRKLSFQLPPPPPRKVKKSFSQIFRKSISFQNAQTKTCTEKIKIQNRKNKPTSFQLSKNSKTILEQKKNFCQICCQMKQGGFRLICSHIFCRECLHDYCMNCLTSGNFQFYCPYQKCGKQIENQTMQYILSQQNYAKVIYFKQKQKNEENLQNRFCPTPDCGQIMVQKTYNKYQCQICHTIICDVCKEAWHQGNCNEVLKKKLEDLFLKNDIKKCPKCLTRIQKQQGCNHLTCKQCKHQFCWICMGAYSKHHYRKYNCFGCPGMLYDKQKNFQAICTAFSIPLLFLAVFLLYFLLLPFYMLHSFLIRPCKLIGVQPLMCEETIVNTAFSCCLQQLKFITIWIIALPRSLLYAIFIAPVMYTISVWTSFYDFICQ